MPTFVRSFLFVLIFFFKRKGKNQDFYGTTGQCRAGGWDTALDVLVGQNCAVTFLKGVKKIHKIKQCNARTGQHEIGELFPP